MIIIIIIWGVSNQTSERKGRVREKCICLFSNFLLHFVCASWYVLARVSQGVIQRLAYFVYFDTTVSVLQDSRPLSVTVASLKVNYRSKHETWHPDRRWVDWKMLLYIINGPKLARKASNIELQQTLETNNALAKKTRCIVIWFEGLRTVCLLFFSSDSVQPFWSSL